MESGDLKVFQAVAREGSITKAAQALNYVQSNVTNRIQQLESQLATQLFYRTNRGMKLTASGKNLLNYADKILNLLDEAVKSTQFAQQPRGPLRLGSLETTAAIHLPKLLTEYHTRFPEVHLSLVSGGPHDLVQKVLHYELDGAFIHGPLEHPDLEQITCFEEELVLISKPSESNLKELLAKPLLFFGVGCSHKSRIERLLQEEGIPQNNIMEFGTLEAILGGVTAGLGVSLLPKSSIVRTESDGRICTHQLPLPYREINVQFIYRRDIFRSSAFQTFIELLKEYHSEEE